MVERDNELKGTTFTISVLHISDGEPERIRQLLAEKVAQAPYFFNCAPLVINVSRLEHIPDFEQLKELVESEEFVLVGITGARSEEMKTAAKAVGLAVMASGKSRKSEPEPEPAPAPAAPEVVPEPEPAPLIPSKVHVGPVRSGQQIYAAGTSLVVLGSVSPGAEVLADDSIHIYGHPAWQSYCRCPGKHPGTDLLPAITGRAALHRGHIPAERCIAGRPDPAAGTRPGWTMNNSE